MGAGEHRRALAATPTTSRSSASPRARSAFAAILPLRRALGSSTKPSFKVVPASVHGRRSRPPRHRAMLRGGIGVRCRARCTGLHAKQIGGRRARCAATGAELRLQPQRGREGKLGPRARRFVLHRAAERFIQLRAISTRCRRSSASRAKRRGSSSGWASSPIRPSRSRPTTTKS